MSKRTAQQQKLIDKYLPDRGDGENQATQAVTAVCKLVYKWYNDGDVYDNHYNIHGWANDISGSANWLYNHIDKTQSLLMEIKYINSEKEYEDLLDELEDVVINENLLSELEKLQHDGDAYHESGPFSFDEDLENEEDEEYDY